MKLPTALVMGLVFLMGCGRASSTHEPESRFLPSGEDSFTALDTTTGELCLTYSFTEEDQVISSMRNETDQEKRQALAGMDDEAKQRVLERLKMPKKLPLCTDLRAELTTKHPNGISAQ